MKWVPENLSYKFVALGVAVLLWLSMMGRKDATVIKDFEVQVQTAPGYELMGAAPRPIRVEVSGPRVALRQLNQMPLVYTIDLTASGEGHHLVSLGRQGLNLPVGMRVMSLEPSEVNVQVRREHAAGGGE